VRRRKSLHRTTRDKNFVGLTQKLFSILETLSQQPKAGVPLDEITRSTGMAKTTVFRLLYSMAKLGYVDQDPVTNLYALSGQFFELGTNALPYQRLTIVAKPLIEALVFRFSESVNLAVPINGLAVYIMVMESPMAYRVASTVGDYSYFHSTSVGKSIAAYLSDEEREQALLRHRMPAMTPKTITTRAAFEEELEKVRREGVAVDNEENAPGIICVGGPIFAGKGKPIAALSVSGPAVRISESLPAIKRAVKETVQKISMLLGYTAVSPPFPTDDEKTGTEANVLIKSDLP
jgi:IclR family transcriptional regulator, KDG regulon repressor